MENEEKEDLLLEVTDSEDEVDEKEEIDYYIEKKILDYIESENPSKQSRRKTFVFVVTCLLLFVSSSVLIVALPVYLKHSSVSGISTYSKLVTLSLVNGAFFIVAHVVGVLSKCGSHTSPSYNLSFGDVVKVSFLLSTGSILVFWLADGNYLSCHLKDPLKGCSVVLSLLFYFVFSRKILTMTAPDKVVESSTNMCNLTMWCYNQISNVFFLKMSLERTFCAITVIVGVFITVDFGICDKFHCNGNSNLTEVMPKLHFLYVIFYILAHGIWILHFTTLEVCWTTFKGSSSHLNVSVLSNVSSNVNSGSDLTKPTIQSLSLICQEEQEEQMIRKKENVPNIKLSKRSYFCSKSFDERDNCGKESENSIHNSVPQGNQLSVPDFKNFPITSTPNNEMVGWHSWTSGCCHDVALWQHITCCLVILGLCWLPTLSFFHGGKGKLLVDVVSEVFDSICCHLCFGCSTKCNYLPTITVFVSISYVVLVLSSIEMLKLTQSAVTIASVMTAALPVASLFWSLFRLDGGAINIVEFNPEITGEAVCAVLGFPIIGIGIVLLIKSHIREFLMVV